MADPRTAADGTAFDVQGEGPAVVLVHGLGLNRQMWQWLSPDLTGFTALRYDLYGHGDSANPPRAPDLRLFSDQLAALLDELKIARCTVAGFSLGGMIARRFAMDHPDRLAALAILNSPHRRSDAAQQAVADRLAQLQQHGPGSTVDAAIARWFSETCQSENPALIQQVKQWVMANDAAIYPTVYRVLVEGVDELIAPQPPIQCPALVLTADDDSGQPPAMAEAIAAEIPGARMEIMHGLRHMALAEAPERFNPLLLSFLRSVPV
jgi:pimeloyl-ACP methyl ester carboxylesterase